MPRALQAAASSRAPASTLLTSPALLRRGLGSSLLLLRRRRPSAPTLGRAAAAEAPTATTTAAKTAPIEPPSASTPAAAAAASVRAFYDAYNRRDLPALSALLDDEVAYSDLVYPQPKRGRAAVMAWLERVSAGAPRDLAFVIEGLAAGEEQIVGGAGDGPDASPSSPSPPPRTVGVGVKWHVALLDGKSGGARSDGDAGAASAATASNNSDSDPIIFPFSRGCSYVEVDARTGLIVRVRDVVEPSSKPGDLALSLLGGLAPLIRAVGPAAAERAGTVVDRRAPAAGGAATRPSSAATPTTPTPASTTPATTAAAAAGTSLPPRAAALWLFYAGYLAIAMLSDLPPGPPAYATQPSVLLEALHESVNLLWIAEGLTKLGLPALVPVVPSHPVSEATFNFAVTWAAMFVPLMFSDARGRRVSGNKAWAVAVVFVTNLFLTPWMALREGVAVAPGSEGGAPPPAPGLQPLPSYARPLGFAAAAAGALCVGWALAGRPEAGGDLAQRWAYLASFAGGDNRVFWAFLLDYALFAVWQASMLSGAPAPYRFLPFAGMAAWLVVRGGGEEEEEGERGTGAERA
jgi:hypothetical protein